ncbi:acetylcholinesterase-like [Brevipalpus obovatus]|uniref:acetylcholinesterase-like n=1 Tax=Brevipalpus obovatus TaxID=246614 RepID=UPI003D9EEFA6
MIVRFNVLCSVYILIVSIRSPSLASSYPAYTSIIQTLDGPIVGIVKNIGGTDLNFFLGIPYAKPPIDDLRLKLPEPVDKWTEILEATELAPRCMQPSITLQYIRQPMSEDCLYLNIITPKGAKKGSKYPVMISILHLDHTEGSGNDEIYLKAELTKKDDGIGGNMGLWDENFAIRWVKNNIEYFGGNPNMITLRGQGSGADNVRAHVLSPYTRGLFQNAIVEGQGFVALGENRLERLLHSSDIILDRIGCSSTKNRLKCVQDVDANDIVIALPKRLYAFGPFYDSNYFSLGKSDEDVISKANDVNLLMGFESEYSSRNLAMRIPEIYAKETLSYEDGIKALEFFVYPSKAEKIAKIFIGHPNKPKKTKEIQNGLVRFANQLVPCLLYYQASLTAEASNLKKGVYTYEYNHLTQSNDYQLCDVQRELGVCYRAAQSSIFGQPYSNYWYHTDEDRRMSDIMMDIYTFFMRTGAKLPSGKEWPNWNDPKSKEPNVATVILDAKNGGIIDEYNPQFCLDNIDLVNSSLITKYYPFDRYELDIQRKVDRRSDYRNNLYPAIQTLYFVDY